jgi:hypothetical protein
LISYLFSPDLILASYGIQTYYYEKHPDTIFVATLAYSYRIEGTGLGATKPV